MINLNNRKLQRWHIIASKNFEDFKKESKMDQTLNNILFIQEGYKTLYRYECMMFNWNNISVKKKKTKRNYCNFSALLTPLSSKYFKHWNIWFIQAINFNHWRIPFKYMYVTVPAFLKHYRVHSTICYNECENS